MEPNHILFHSIHQLSRKLTKRLNEALEPFGLYSSQWSVLYVLKENGSLTQKELCEYLAVEAPPMSRVIQRLVNQGYIEQQTGEDKRKKFITLTGIALKEYPKWEKAVAELNKNLAISLPEASSKQLQSLLTDWIRLL